VIAQVFIVDGAPVNTTSSTAPSSTAPSSSLPRDQIRSSVSGAAEPKDVATFDVAGVRLGMTADEAIDALRKFDASWPVLKKRYLNGNGVNNITTYGAAYGQLGYTEDCSRYQGEKLLVAIVAAKANRVHVLGRFSPSQLAAMSEV